MLLLAIWLCNILAYEANLMTTSTSGSHIHRAEESLALTGCQGRCFDSDLAVGEAMLSFLIQ